MEFQQISLSIKLLRSLLFESDLRKEATAQFITFVKNKTSKVFCGVFVIFHHIYVFVYVCMHMYLCVNVCEFMCLYCMCVFLCIV